MRWRNWRLNSTFFHSAGKGWTLAENPLRRGGLPVCLLPCLTTWLINFIFANLTYQSCSSVSLPVWVNAFVPPSVCFQQHFVLLFNFTICLSNCCSVLFCLVCLPHSLYSFWYYSVWLSVKVIIEIKCCCCPFTLSLALECSGMS